MSMLWEWFTRRIQLKILVPVLGIFIVLSGVTLGFIYSRIKQDLLQSARQEALSTTQIVALTLYRNYEIDNDSREIQSYVYGARKYKANLLEINVVDRDLRIVSSTNEENLLAPAAGEDFARALGNEGSVRLVVDGKPPFVEVVYPVSAGPARGNVATGAVQIRASLASQFEYLDRIRTNTLVAGAFIMLGISLAITLISRSITRPIHNLYDAMGDVNEGSLEVRVPVVSRDEVGYLTTTFNGMIERLRRMVESSRRFVPDQFLTALDKDDITDVVLGDAILRDMAVLFMDIRGFTPMSERMTADENLTFVNSLLERVLPAIEAYHGFIDKYMGDAIMALFAEGPDDALLAGLSLQEAMVAYNRDRRTEGLESVTVGVGINYGELILGTVGSRSRLDTTVIGSTVNVAARLEKLTKEHGVPIILPEPVFDSLRDSTRSGLRTRRLGMVEIRGVEKPVPLVGVLLRDGLVAGH